MHLLCTILIFINFINFLNTNDISQCFPCLCDVKKNNEVEIYCNSKFVINTKLSEIPSVITNYNLGEIVVLNFEDQDFTTLNENSFIKFPNVTKIILSFNKISYIHPHSLRNVTNLTHLKLDNNKIKYLPEGVFSHTPKIAFIFLENNFITSLNNDIFNDLLYLEEIHLNHNFLTTIQRSSIKNIGNKFKLIDFSYNNLTNLQLNIFDTNLTNLNHVYLDHNPWICNTELCELKNKAFERQWLHGRMPECYFPHKSNINWDIFEIKNSPKLYISQTRKIYLDEGENLTLSCEINSCSDSLHVSWYFNTVKIINDNVTETIIKNKKVLNLELLNVQKSNEGLYDCIIEEHGNPTDNITVEIALNTVNNGNNGGDSGNYNFNITGDIDADIKLPSFDFGLWLFFLGLFIGIMLIGGLWLLKEKTTCLAKCCFKTTGLAKCCLKPCLGKCCSKITCLGKCRSETNDTREEIPLNHISERVTS